MLTLVLIAHTQEREQGSIDVLIQVLQSKKVMMEVVYKKKGGFKKKSIQNVSAQASSPSTPWMLANRTMLTD